MFTQKDDSIIQKNNQVIEDNLNQEVEENKVKQLAIGVIDSVGFITGFIAAIAGSNLIYTLVLGSLGLGQLFTMGLFLLISLIFVLIAFKLKTDNWVPQLGGQYV